MDIFKKINKIKDAIIETAKEDPAQATIAIGAGLGLGMALALTIDVEFCLRKEIKNIEQAATNAFAVAQAGYIANNQCCSNLRAQVNYISEHLGIAEECKKVGVDSARQVFKEAGFTELDAGKMASLLEASRPIMDEFLDAMVAVN